jgi:iron complex outermembrane receptor protein
VLYSDLYYKLPGGLTKEQCDENPHQARPASVQQNASIDHRNLRIGLVNDLEWKKSGNMTAFYVSLGKKINPFITNYEIEKARSAGGRTRFYFEKRIFGFQNRFTIGAEWNYGQLKATNFGNAGGVADTLRYKEDIRATDVMIFGKSELKIRDKWILDIGMSYSTLTYDIHRIEDRGMNTSYRVNRKFVPVVSPRIGLVKKLKDETVAHFSISTGFSPPVIDEIRTSDGIINKDLEAEKGINLETGIRDNLLNKRLNVDISAFLMRQKNTIVSQITAG